MACCWGVMVVPLARATGHEVRNPLHGIRCCVDACLEGALGPAELRAELQAISDGVDMLVRVTNDMYGREQLQVRLTCCWIRVRLDHQRLRAGRVAITSLPTAVRALLNSCASAIIAAAGAGGVLVQVADDVPDMVREAVVRALVDVHLFCGS